MAKIKGMSDCQRKYFIPLPIMRKKMTSKAQTITFTNGSP